MDENISDLMRLDHEIDEFIEKHANTFVKWEVVQFFHDHSQEWIRAEELAKTLNRPLRVIKKEIRELYANGLLEEQKSDQVHRYRFRPPDTEEGRALRATLARLIALCHEREGRLRVVYKLLKNGKALQN
jgi:hypothetical protein